jgi:hypothetical protein
MAGTSRDLLVQPSHRFHQANASCESKEDQPTNSFTGNHSLLTKRLLLMAENTCRKGVGAT